MKILHRLSNLLKSNLNAAIDSLSDPGKEIDLLIGQMEDEARSARVALRDQIAQEKVAQKRVDEAYRSVDRWREHAERAVQAGDDDLAKEALRRQQEAERQHEEAEKQLAEQSRLVVQLTERIRENDRKIAEIKGRKETLKARARATKQALSPEGDAFSRFDQLVSQIEMTEHQADAMADMAKDPTLAPPQSRKDQETDEKFDRLLPGKSDRELEDRLAALKAKLDKKTDEP
jgi:phage shock protein A